MTSVFVWVCMFLCVLCVLMRLIVCVCAPVLRYACGALLFFFVLKSSRANVVTHSNVVLCTPAIVYVDGHANKVIH